MSSIPPQVPAIARRRWIAPLGWTLAGLIFAAPLVTQSLAMQSLSLQSGENELNVAMARSTALLVASLVVALLTIVVLALWWTPVIRRIGNTGLATIAMFAAIQFSVAYAARLIGSVLGVLLGPAYLFVDGLGSKGLACLLLGMLITLLPTPGVLALQLATVFLLNAIVNGQLGLVPLLFIMITIFLHEALAALLGVTTGRAREATGDDAPMSAARWSFAVRVGLAIGVAQCLSLLAQYELTTALLRIYFDMWYKLAVSIITGLLYGGVGAVCGAVLGRRLRRVAP